MVIRLDSSASETYEIRDTDIAFLDVLMPRVSGLQVLEQLGRQNVKSPIALMSGNDHYLLDAEEAIKKLHHWHLETFHKPFTCWMWKPCWKKFKAAGVCLGFWPDARMRPRGFISRFHQGVSLEVVLA